MMTRRNFSCFLLAMIAPVGEVSYASAQVPALSGMAEFPQASTSGGVSRFVVVLDTKNSITITPTVIAENLGVISVDPSNKSLSYDAVQSTWNNISRYFPAPNDLESICLVPGSGNEFLIAESGFVGDDFGRVLRVRVIGSPGAWRSEVVGHTLLPRDIKRVEALACVAAGSSTLLVLGERELRTDGAGNQLNNIRWQTVDLANLPASLTLADGLTFSPPRPPNVNRQIADFHVLGGDLWLSSTWDPGQDLGPFRSAVYRAASINSMSRTPIVLRNLTSTDAIRIEGFKVEALGPGVGRPGELLSLGTDEESLGGTWRMIALP